MTLVLEYMNRGSLQDALKSGPLAECYIKRIAKMGLSGLRDMHKNNMVHRDIKPGNMLCNHKGEVKIADFGIVRELGAGGNEVANTFVGTQLYMSPERIAKDSYSFAADIWSLGMTLLTLAIGEYPYKNITNKGFILLFQTLTEEPIPNLDTNIYSTGFIDFIGHCLEKDPAKRWNAEQLLEHSFLANVDITQQLKWPWDKQYLEREEASIADLANSLGESIFANRPYTHTDEDIKLFQSIGESLGMQHQEAIILLERNLPMHCWFNTTQKTNLSRRSSMKPSRTSHNRTSSGEFSAGGITSPSNSVLSEITTAMLLARKVSF
jgi:serine/threonine protein kinase